MLSISNIDPRRGLVPVPLLPFKIRKRSSFLNRNHPYINPQESEEEEERYTNYWTGELKKIIEGHWGEDKSDGIGGYRYMPGNLYFYVNFTQILRQDELGNQEISDYPDLRDVDWFIFYGLKICDGFSGFENDKYRTSYRTIKKIEDGEKIGPTEKLLLEKYDRFLRKPNGEYKDYYPARELLYAVYDQPMGRPQSFNPAEDMILFSTRRCGKTYGIANGVPTYDFVTNGAATIEQYFEGNSSSTSVVGSAESSKSAEFMSRVSDTLDFLRTGPGSYTYVDEKGDEQEAYGPFFTPTEGSIVVGNRLTNAVSSAGGKGKEGAGSKIVHVTYKTNKQAGVGYGARRMVIEEVGLEPKFDEVRQANDATQKRETKYGYSIYIGTGGDVKLTAQIEKKFYNPEKYKIIGVPNQYGGKADTIAYFVSGAYYNNLFRDENGNQDYEQAFEQLILERQEFLDTGDIKDYEKHCIFYPLKPSEMFAQESGGTMPRAQAGDAYHKLLIDFEQPSLGMLHWTDARKKDGAFWKEDLQGSKKWINQLDHKDWNNKESVCAVYEHPVDLDPSRDYDKYPQYIVTYDSVIKEGEGSSLCYVQVMKLEDMDPNKISNNIVAEWYGRFDNIDDNHAIAYKFATYYGCKLLPEINITDVLSYARRNNLQHKLEKSPKDTLQRMVKQRSYDVGVRITTSAMISKCESFTRDFLMSPIITDYTITEDGVYREVKTTLEMMKSPIVLDAVANYNREENNDPVSGTFISVLWMREIASETGYYSRQETTSVKKITQQALEMETVYS